MLETFLHDPSVGSGTRHHDDISRKELAKQRHATIDAKLRGLSSSVDNDRSLVNRERLIVEAQVNRLMENAMNDLLQLMWCEWEAHS